MTLHFPIPFYPYKILYTQLYLYALNEHKERDLKETRKKVLRETLNDLLNKGYTKEEIKEELEDAGNDWNSKPY